MTRYPLVWLTTPEINFLRGHRRVPGNLGGSPGRGRRAATLDTAVAPTPSRGPAPLLLPCRATCYSGCSELRCLLAEDAEVSAPELEVAHGADRGADAVRETSQVVDEQLRTRLVGREAVGRVGQHERVREVRVRAVDQRDVAAVERGRRVVDVQDPDGLGRDTTRLEGDALLGGRGGRKAHAQAAVHAERRVLELDRRVVHADAAAVAAELAREAAVVQRDGRGDQAGREELRRRALDGRDDVFGRIGVAGAEQDDRLADLRALTQHVQHVARGVVGPERTAEDVDAVATTRRGGRTGGERTCRADAAHERQRRRTGEQLALEGHRCSLLGTTAVPCARLLLLTVA